MSDELNELKIERWLKMLDSTYRNNLEEGINLAELMGECLECEMEEGPEHSNISLKRPQSKAKLSGVDFETGRSAKKLANAFNAYFRPSTSIDDSSDEGFVFCPSSKRSCKHHCNHIWTHDKCCWCGQEVPE